jgi:hypothetical protein
VIKKGKRKRGRKGKRGEKERTKAREKKRRCFAYKYLYSTSAIFIFTCPGQADVVINISPADLGFGSVWIWISPSFKLSMADLWSVMFAGEY